MLGIDRHAARVTWTVALVAGAFWLTFLVRQTLVVFALALFATYLIAPLERLLDRYAGGRLPRIISVSGAFFLVIAAIATALSFIGPTISEQGSQLVERLPALAAQLNSTQAIPLPAALEPWRDRLAGMLQHVIADAGGGAVPFARRVVQSLLGLLGNLVYVVVIPIVAFLMLKDGPMIRRAIERAPVTGERRGMANALSDVDRVLGQYVRALGLLSLATLAVYTGFFVISGVPFGALLATLAAILEFIPVIGPLTAAGLALLVALMAGYEHPAWLVFFFLAYRIFQDYVLSPRLMSGGLGIHPALIIFGFLAGEELGGIAGMFLAVPVLAVLRTLLASDALRRENMPRSAP